MKDRSQPGSRDVARAYRAANDALDERAELATRNAILAAAARAVDAKPAAAGSQPMRRWRFPLAAAATMLISTVAVILAQRTGQELPTTVIAENLPPVAAPHSGAEASMTVKPQVAPADVAVPAPAATPKRKDSATGARGAAVSGAAHVPGRSTVAGEDRSGPATAAPGATADTAAAERDSLRSRVAQEARVAAAAPQESSPSAPAGKLATAPPTSNAGFGQSAAPSSSAAPMGDARPRVLEPRVTAGAVQPAPATPTSLAKTTETPERWLARIIELRHAARDDEADAELRKLRELHPDLAIPPAALRRTGTR
jgi:hypothetical protein